MSQQKILYVNNYIIYNKVAFILSDNVIRKHIDFSTINKPIIEILLYKYYI